MKSFIAKPILKTFFVLMLLVWANHVYAQGPCRDITDYDTCMYGAFGCAEAMELCTQNCPEPGSDPSCMNTCMADLNGCQNVCAQSFCG